MPAFAAHVAGSGRGGERVTWPLQEECCGVSDPVKRNKAQGTYLTGRGAGGGPWSHLGAGRIAGDVLERAGLTWREGPTLYLAQERPTTVQVKGIPAKQRECQVWPRRCRSEPLWSGLSSFLTCCPFTCQGPRDRPCYAGTARVKPRCSSLHPAELGREPQSWVSLQYPETFSSWWSQLPTSPSRKPLGEPGLFQGVVA